MQSYYRTARALPLEAGRSALTLGLLLVFLAGSSGLLLAVHVHAEDPEHHDPVHCDSCQMLLHAGPSAVPVENGDSLLPPLRSDQKVTLLVDQFSGRRVPLTPQHNRAPPA